jgi:hypothetical protein
VVFRIVFPSVRGLILDQSSEAVFQIVFPSARGLILDLFASEVTVTCFGENKRNFDRIFVSLMQSMMHDSVYE